MQGRQRGEGLGCYREDGDERGVRFEGRDELGVGLQRDQDGFGRRNAAAVESWYVSCRRFRGCSERRLTCTPDNR